MSVAIPTHPVHSTEGMSLLDKLNGPWHERALWTYTAIVLAHWAEHLAQTYQIYVLGWNIPNAQGVLGLWFPALIKSETLHYSYAIVMLVAFWLLRRGFEGRSRTWWMIAFWVQFWHHIEHATLLGQAIVGHNLFNSPVPLSLAQIVIPRVELHLFYNTVVTVPMVVAMFYHMFPSPEEEARMTCSCSKNPRIEGMPVPQTPKTSNA